MINVIVKNEGTYRVTKKNNTMPITTATHAPSVPPTITVKLFNEEAVLKYFSSSAETDLKGEKIIFYIVRSFWYC